MTDSGAPKSTDCKEVQGEVSKVKQRLCAHIQQKRASALGEPSSSCEPQDEKNTINVENEKQVAERDDGQQDAGASSSQEGEQSNAPSPVHHVAQGQSSGTGTGNDAASLMLSNSILDEVLNEKKLALLRSPDVVQFLREAQKKTDESK